MFLDCVAAVNSLVNRDILRADHVRATTLHIHWCVESEASNLRLLGRLSLGKDLKIDADNTAEDRHKSARRLDPAPGGLEIEPFPVAIDRRRGRRLGHG